MIYVWRFIKLVVSLVLALGVGAVGLSLTYGLKWARDLPDYRELDSLTLGATTRVYARDLTPLGSLVPRIGSANVNRTLVTLDDISPYMMAALVTSEDRRFFEHYGLDPYSFGRSLQRALNGDRVEGTSTLTNQLVKNTLLADLKSARTLERKVKEWMLSVQIERSFTKEEILQDYLNIIYWGDGGPVEIAGLYAASQAYFGKSPRRLSLAESVFLTNLVPSPGRYFRYPQMRPLMKSLLERMVEDGWVTRAQADAAWREKLVPRGWKVTYDAKGNIKTAKLVNPAAKNLKAVTVVRAPHFMQQVEAELRRRLGAERVYGSGGLVVYTTLDPQAQSAAEAASRNAAVPPGATLAEVLLDPYTGEVVALVGQKLKGTEPPPEWNNAAQGQRQVGSSIKPLLYTTALSTGIDQLHTEKDEPTEFPCKTCPGGAYKPQNFAGRYSYRDLTLRESLNRSLNIPTLKLADEIGLDTFRGKLRELGFEPPASTGLSLAIGTLETTPLRMAAAYAPFVNGGTWREPRFISRVTTAAGEVLYDAATDRTRAHRVWSPQIAYLGLDMLYGVVNDLDTDAEGGLAFRARIQGWQVGGKTGTTNDVRDLWFVGVTPMYVGAVWVGKQQGGTMGQTDFSGFVNPPIWKAMMTGALAGKPPREFAVPDGIARKPGPFKNEIAVLDPNYRQDNVTKVERAEGPPPPREAKLPPEDDRRLLAFIDRRTGRLATEFTPPEAVVQRLVLPEDLPGYAPDPNPAPLPEEKPAQAKPAPKKPASDDIPQAPPPLASTGTTPEAP